MFTLIRMIYNILTLPFRILGWVVNMIMGAILLVIIIAGAWFYLHHFAGTPAADNTTQVFNKIRAASEPTVTCMVHSAWSELPEKARESITKTGSVDNLDADSVSTLYKYYSNCREVH